MPGTYTYDPMLPTNKDEMRFQLGDVLVSDTDPTDGSKCVISDEEIMAMIAKHSDDWNGAKLAIIDAICMKLSYEVTVSVGDMALELGKRAWLWEQRRTALRKEIQSNQSGAVPRWNSASMSNAADGGHYFKRNAHSNPGVMPYDGLGEL